MVLLLLFSSINCLLLLPLFVDFFCVRSLFCYAVLCVVGRTPASQRIYGHFNMSGSFMLTDFFQDILRTPLSTV